MPALAEAHVAAYRRFMRWFDARGGSFPPSSAMLLAYIEWLAQEDAKRVRP